MGIGRRLHPPDNEPHRRGVRLGLEGGVGGLGHIGAVHPVGNRRPVLFGYRLDEIVQAFVLADGDGEAHVHLAADEYHAMSVEAAVGPYGELPSGSAVTHPSHRFTQEVGGAGAGGDGQQRVIAPGAGVAVVAGAPSLARP